MTKEKEEIIICSCTCPGCDRKLTKETAYYIGFFPMCVLEYDHIVEMGRDYVYCDFDEVDDDEDEDEIEEEDE